MLFKVIKKIARYIVCDIINKNTKVGICIFHKLLLVLRDKKSRLAPLATPDPPPPPPRLPPPLVPLPSPPASRRRPKWGSIVFNKFLVDRVLRLESLYAKFFGVGDLSPPPSLRRWREDRVESFSPWRFRWRWRRQLQRQHPHWYDDMKTFISERWHQGGDSVTVME